MVRRLPRQVAAAERAIPGTSISLPAPTGGLNTRDPVDQMPPTDAVMMENWLPEQNVVRLRPGHSVHCATGQPGAVESLLAWDFEGSRKLLAAVSGGIQDVTTATASSVVTASTYTNNLWQSVNAGGYLIACNGADSPWHYNASGLSNTGFTGTGLSVSDLIAVEHYKSRLYFIEKDTANFWYGGVNNIVSGTLTKFDLGQIARDGGTLQALGTWSTRTGDNLAEYIVFIMSTGETLIYSGSDPGSDFALIQRVQVGEPIGRRCVDKLGGDLIVITKQSFLPMSFIIAGGTAAQLDISPVWGKIRRAAQEAAEAYSANEGWQVMTSSTGREVYFNVPRSPNVQYTQYVLSVAAGAWTDYSGWQARCFARLGGVDYWGTSDGDVMQIGGVSDNGSDIVATADTAFSYAGDRGSRKRFTAVRPVVKADGVFQATIGVNVDFSDRSFPATNVEIGQFSVGAEWDEPEWDTVDWADDPQPNQSWVSVTGIGRSVSLSFGIRTQLQEVVWYSTDFLGQRGSVR